MNINSTSRNVFVILHALPLWIYRIYHTGGVKRGGGGVKI